MQAAVIEDIVGEFVVLKRSGSSYRGLSPFSSERTPSFFVVPSKGIYKDFSSGKGGNVVDFLMQYEKLTYPEAIRWLAGRYQIDIEEDEKSDQDVALQNEREKLSLLSEFARGYFSEQLMDTEEGVSIGLSYFHERGFSEDTIRKFQLGYCPDGWDTFSKAALEKGFSKDTMLKTGLSRERESGLYDFFRGRVIFPIHSIAGKTIAFAGRTLKADKGVAKYFNSPESELYNKSNVLFGMHLAKNAIVKEDNCYLVEGYTDVISLHQAGVENVVASSGTSLTDGQIKLIRRYTANITILYDGDSAGIKASFRGIDLILKSGMNVRVVLFPDGDDPDSFARKHSTSEIQDYVKSNARDFISFKVSLLSEEAGKDPIKKAALIKGIVESIALIPDAISRSVYLQETSRQLSIEERTLYIELNQILAKQPRDRQSAVAEEEGPKEEETPREEAIGLQATSEDGLLAQERDFVRLLLTYGDRMVKIATAAEGGEEKEIEVTVAEYLVHHLKNDDMRLNDEVLQQIVEEYLDLTIDDSLPETDNFTGHSDSRISGITSDLLISKYQLSENWTTKHLIYPETEEMLLKKAVKDCIHRLKLHKVQQMIRLLLEEISATTDTEKIEHLQREHHELLQMRKKISQYFGTVIL
jgi:DNA primase